MLRIIFTSITLSMFAFLSSNCEANNSPTVMMLPNSVDFFDMPWPNGIRLRADGTLDLKHFPLLKNPVGYMLASAGAKYTHGFGTNTAIYFKTTVELDIESLPDIKQSTLSDASAMLVNLNKSSKDYLKLIPLQIDFRSQGTKYRPGNTLALLPMPGFNLESNSTYAALLFDGIHSHTGQPLLPAPLLAELDKPWASSSALQLQQFVALQQQKAMVTEFVTQHTAWRAEQLIAFTLYTTQNTTHDADVILSSTDAITPTDIVLGNVDQLTVVKSCQCSGDACDTNSNNLAAEIKGRYRTPQWQHGFYPYLLGGGNFKFDSNHQPIVHHWKANNFYLVVPCMAAPAHGFSASIRADESGAPLNNALDVWDYYQKANVEHAFNQIVISTEPYISSDPKLQPLFRGMQKLLKTMGLDIDYPTLGVLVIFGTNTVATRNISIQEASDLAVLKKVLLNLPALVEKNTDLLQSAGIGLENFKVNQHKLGFEGQSQGAGAGVLLLAHDHSFDFAHLNGTPTLSYTTVPVRKKLKEAMAFFIAGLQEDDLDIFHPILQLVQTMTEPSNGLNFASRLEVAPLLITHGTKDNCVARESGEALALALARKGVLSTVEGSNIDWLMPMLGQETVTLPYRLSTAQEKNHALFLETPIGHFAEGIEQVIGRYLYEMGLEHPVEDVLIDIPIIPHEFSNC